MRILFLDQFSDLGGAQQCLVDLLPAIAASGFSAHVAAPGDGPLHAAARRLGATADAISCGSYTAGRKTAADALRFASAQPRLVARIANLIGRYGIDLVYANGPRVLPAAAWAAKGRAPLLFHSHSYLSKRYALAMAAWALRHARATVIASCHFTGEPLRKHVEPERFHVVYNGVAGPPSDFRRSAGSGRPRIGVIGRVAPEKGQSVFLEAARLLPDLRYIVCGATLFGGEGFGGQDGAGYARHLRALAVGLDVEFTGWREDVYTVIGGLDLLVVPSRREEGTTRVILEAYAAGLPVVAFPAGGVREVVEDEVTGFLARSFTAEALASRIAEVLALPADRTREVAGRARAAWEERHTVERYREGVLRVILGARPITRAAFTTRILPGRDRENL